MASGAPSKSVRQQSEARCTKRCDCGCSLCKAKRLGAAAAKTASKPEDEADYVEGVVCTVDDIKENEIKQFDLLDAGKVLLVRQNGRFSALGNKCTHYGAPLTGAALSTGRLRCQWHGACFNLKTGDIEDFPGLDSLPCFQVSVNNKDVVVRARRSELTSGRRIKTMVGRDVRESQTIVAIGGGPSTAAFVETLRQEGFNGRVVVVAKENYNPYDRIKLSKSMDFPMNKCELRTDDFYAEHGIEIMKGVAATAVDSGKKCVDLSDGETLRYDRLYVATGSKPVKASIEGNDLKNVVTLRDYDDAQYINSQLTERSDVVILGSSFIAMESAAYCVDKVASVTVIARDTVPFRGPFGEPLGKAILSLFVDKGVAFKPQSGISRIVEKEDGCGAVGSVQLLDGTVLKADVVLMGIGSTLNTEFLQNSGVNVDATKGHVSVNEYMQTNAKDVYAGGDIACAPIWCAGDVVNTIGHFPLAQMHGRTAGLNILGKKTPLHAVPYFWTTLFGKSVRYAGYGEYDNVVYAGDVQELKFAAFYLHKDRVIAVSSCMMDPIVSKYAELLASGKQLHRKDLVGDPTAWANK